METMMLTVCCCCFSGAGDGGGRRQDAQGVTAPRAPLLVGGHHLPAAGVCNQPGGAWLNASAPSQITLRRAPHVDHPVIEVVDEDVQSGSRPGEDVQAGLDTYPRVLPSAPRPQPLPNVTLTTLPPRLRPWYLNGGELRQEMPRGPGRPHCGPAHVPSRPAPLEDHPDPAASDKAPPSYKKILMYNGELGPGGRRGQFLKLKCPVDTCVLTGSRSELSSADAIMFKDHFSMPPHNRDMRQVWVMFMLECPLHTQHFTNRNVFNWTATYRHDSDIVAPYEKWVYYDNTIHQKSQEINYAANKTKQVAWFVQNCGARNNRLQYAKELGKYIGVDIFGACGTKRCPRSNSAKCFEMLNKDYKFYLAFENSNCRDYITEKFFVNGLSHHILPIVMGAHPDDYARQAPEKSYIHIDDFETPRELASYLHLLDQNDDLYNEYFRWKGTGEFINTYFMCRLCGMLHDEGHQQHYEDINVWWRGTGTCINGSWRKYDKFKMEPEKKKTPEG
ncbi:LOW QUALITY PROTEIN: glycoprotein 3-alpha-L-fucosyltransferase A-like [Homarus americanus]|uniref:LOW QUALITY PROTEIN: glycoprotein 3-alpha-L-fucosyltransferase A-like n=1 Tax=Homarus americanus TaxID=6706 RepID=UPI001C46E2F9|nr:LOW QUALITY PROTEIN: glycoprotein 3-alpha-L-fucosyltransferase A-like [Homarus americanus]